MWGLLPCFYIILWEALINVRVTPCVCYSLYISCWLKIVSKQTTNSFPSAFAYKNCGEFFGFPLRHGRPFHGNSGYGLKAIPIPGKTTLIRGKNWIPEAYSVMQRSSILHGSCFICVLLIIFNYFLTNSSYFLIENISLFRSIILRYCVIITPYSKGNNFKSIFNDFSRNNFF